MTNTLRQRPRPTRIAVATAILVAATSLAACGEPNQTSAEPSQTQASAAPGGGPRGGEQLTKIRGCLKAAGIDVPDMPSGMPSDGPSGISSGAPTGRPSDMPSGRPSDMPSGRPNGMPSGGPGGISFDDANIKKALQACGIEIPSGQPSAPPRR